jgi:hypothetical protein
VKALILLFASLSAFAAPPAAESSSAQITAQVTDQAVTLKVVPPPGTHLNYDGPWKLQVSGDLALKKSSGVFQIQDFDKTNEMFQLPLAKKPTAAEKSEYTLAYFLCSDGNTWCRRIEAQGTLQSSTKE